MEKKLQDYIHYYLGCRVIADQGTMTYTLASITKTKDNQFICVFLDEHGFSCNLSAGWKPILRKLDDATYPEILKALHMSFDNYHFSEFEEVNNNEFGWRARNQNGMECFCAKNTHKPEVFVYLIKQGIDLFGLIPSGLALDANKIK